MSGSRRLLGALIRVAALLAAQALVLLLASAILPGGETLSFEAAVLVAVVLAVIATAPTLASPPTRISVTFVKPRRVSHAPAPAGTSRGVSPPSIRSDARSRWS